VSEDGRRRMAVRATDVEKRFAVRGWWPGRPKAQVHALRGATMAVEGGTIHGIIGPNGSGKTTLLRILATLVTPDAGTAEVDGHDVETAGELVRRSIGLSTGEERSVYWRLTARQNLEFAATLYDVANPREAIAAALELTELAADADRPVSGFSQGMARRLGLARAVLHRPRLLLLDEPTRSLDPTARSHFHDLLVSLRAEGVTTLLTTHDLGEAAAVCDQVSALRGGVFVAHLVRAAQRDLEAVLREPV
jgi:ABC-2 type transport system ATP-binding protein